MSDAPETIWATGNKTTGSWNHTPLSLRIAPVQTAYTRTDISQARIAELEAALVTAREDALREAEKAMRDECTAPEGTYHPISEKAIWDAESATVEIASMTILALLSKAKP
jgi:hypothetical protein